MKVDFENILRPPAFKIVQIFDRHVECMPKQVYLDEDIKWKNNNNLLKNISIATKFPKPLVNEMHELTSYQRARQ